MFAAFQRISLTRWIIIAMVAGVLTGWLFPGTARNFSFLSTLFLHLIKCIIVPLVFGTLVVGIAGHAADLRSTGRVALKSFVYFEVITTAALFVGLAVVNVTKPGAGFHLNATAATGEQVAATKITFAGIMEHLAPQSFFDAAARNDVLQVVVFAVLFGIAVARVEEKSRRTMVGFCESLSEVMFKFTSQVMWFAPLGVGGALAGAIGQNGLGVVFNLGKLVLALYGALVIFVIGVFIPVMLLTGIPVIRFFKTIREPALLAFSTASSEAALPDALRLMEEFGVPRRIVAFVLPAGYCFNLDGTTLYLALASVFIAQAAGIKLTLAQQLPIMLTLMLTSKGVAGVPRVSVVVLSGTLAAFGLPLEGVAVILGVDAFLDMARTCVNVIGNSLASAVIARWEGELNFLAP